MDPLSVKTFFILLTGCVFTIVNCYDLELSTRFTLWAKEHGKQYHSREELSYRRSVFRATDRLIEKHNAANHTYTLGHNHFSDSPWPEFQRHVLMARQTCSAATPSVMRVRRDVTLPPHIDWRTKGIVSPVKNQEHCGSCWTFSTTGAMEAHMALYFGEKLSLSEQQLIDCAGDFNNHGCSGGLPSQAFEYIHYGHGLDQETDYPYHANETGSCLFKRPKAKAFVAAIHNITEANEGELAEAVAWQGPVSIAFQVAKDFKQYKSGVYDSTVCKSGPQDINHAVLAVGYDVTADGRPYWIIKNSWSTSWGMEGYFQMTRGKNMCGVADCASYPVVSDREMVVS